MEARLLPYRDRRPRLADDAFVAPGAVLIGDVELGARASVWFGCVVRGDVCHVRIGARTNFQDGSIIHVSRAGLATLIGVEVTVGHGCIVHACTLEDRSFVGMGSVILDGARIESEGMLGAGSLLPPGKVIGRRELWLGRPARLVRMLRDDELADNAERNQHYVELAAEYLARERREEAPEGARSEPKASEVSRERGEGRPEPSAQAPEGARSEPKASEVNRK